MFNLYINNRKGVALFLVLMTLLIVVILANVVLSIILSQSRLTHHQVSRIQAYYAAQAGMNYALEQLRTGAWTFSPTNSCSTSNPCIVNESDFPVSIRSFDGSSNKQFRIIFCPTGSTCAGISCSPPSGTNFCLQSAANYTYTP